MIAVRLYYLAPSQNSNPTLSSVLSHILTEAALEYALAATSIIALKPFLKPFHSGAIINTVGGAGSGMYSGSASAAQGLYMLSSVSKKNHDLTPKSTTVSSDRDIEIEKPKQWQKTTSAKGQSHAEAQRGESPTRGSTGSQEMIIQTTRDWSVHYEERHEDR